MLTLLRRCFHWLVEIDSPEPGSDANEIEAYGSWHGDHWHNLLCSPMDARHYVMEDWSLQSEPPESPAR
ncbi:hypothetical protein B0G62_115133 [Paraburkholderia eburnea]|uniref:Uncharacterized protein n=1 Tax=Paraburkholderia eburnea TaxID=1189126 RepID=A0A2S4M0T4_9BURK|nr:hypothetical protein [Paraburkholderia eburnea]POR48247.1 hypothetical protein B0G62_115133 [Paraburkholderia eburnea]PRZ22171.1 hypothetical protein BX588_1076 [Paraburkholderia eburnea]